MICLSRLSKKFGMIRKKDHKDDAKHWNVTPIYSDNGNKHMTRLANGRRGKLVIFKANRCNLTNKFIQLCEQKSPFLISNEFESNWKMIQTAIQTHRKIGGVKFNFNLYPFPLTQFCQPITTNRHPLSKHNISMKSKKWFHYSAMALFCLNLLLLFSCSI